ncbi:hypothetical protein [Rahnella laticis]|uniref:hypothetical protein n=1 Tax=Rahnella laticis TaxID=2787622 RepID=UPI0018A255D5|nr:hypothetical protein [Rahnella laticis]MBF7997675.1 hypothetical protein [Rahnella laticis]
MSFFEEFDEASWEFTYGHETNDHYNVLQVGLVAILHIDKAWELQKRQAVAEAIEVYISKYGDKLQHGYIGNVNQQEEFVLLDSRSRIDRLLAL